MMALTKERVVPEPPMSGVLAESGSSAMEFSTAFSSLHAWVRTVARY